MTHSQLSLAVVGADYPNRRGPSRRFGIGLCAPGDPVRLLREPKNAFDEYAISVFDERDIQLGYVRSERAAWLAPQIDRGLEVRAIFQESTSYGCAIRAAFGGEDPQLPSHHDQRPTQEEQDWWPDPEPLDE